MRSRQQLPSTSRRGRRSRRANRNRNPHSSLATTNFFHVVNPGTRLTTHTRRYDYYLDATCQPDQVTTYDISLLELLGTSGEATILEWFDQFKISEVEFWVIGMDTQGSSPGDTPSLSVVANIDNTNPTTTAELVRMMGARTFPLNFAHGAILGGKIKPAFDINGSQNHYVNDFISTVKSGVEAPWKAFSFGMHGKTSTVSIHILMKATVVFRGQQ